MCQERSGYYRLYRSMDSPNDLKRWTTPSACHLRFDELSLDDRSFPRDKLAKITTAKVEHETGQLNTPLERAEACLPLRPIDTHHAVCLYRLTTSTDISPRYISLFLAYFSTRPYPFSAKCFSSDKSVAGRKIGPRQFCKQGRCSRN